MTETSEGRPLSPEQWRVLQPLLEDDIDREEESAS